MTLRGGPGAPHRWQVRAKQRETRGRAMGKLLGTDLQAVGRGLGGDLWARGAVLFFMLRSFGGAKGPQHEEHTDTSSSQTNRIWDRSGDARGRS
jgi:hypothetical protein